MWIFSLSLSWNYLLQSIWFAFGHLFSYLCSSMNRNGMDWFTYFVSAACLQHQAMKRLKFCWNMVQIMFLCCIFLPQNQFFCDNFVSSSDRRIWILKWVGALDNPMIIQNRAFYHPNRIIYSGRVFPFDWFWESLILWIIYLSYDLSSYWFENSNTMFDLILFFSPQVPPKSLKIIDRSENKSLIGKVGPYQEGSILRLSCEADEGKWRKLYLSLVLIPFARLFFASSSYSYYFDLHAMTFSILWSWTWIQSNRQHNTHNRMPLSDSLLWGLCVCGFLVSSAQNQP